MLQGIIQILLFFTKYFFIGFGILMPIIALIKTSSLNALSVKELFIVKAVQAVKLLGIAYFLLGFAVYIGYIQRMKSVEYTDGVVPKTGDILISIFTVPLLCLIITQLFRIKKTYHKKWLLITLSLLLLITATGREAFIFLRYLHYDFYKPNWLLLLGNVLRTAFQSLILFFFTTLILMLASGKLKVRKAS